MNKDFLKNNWKDIKGKVKSQWGKLTDNDIEQIAGNCDTLRTKLKTIYGYKDEEADKAIKKFHEQCESKEKTW
jgi:uncharacterized protein YjbJ (UPF0337 family)